MSWLLERLRKYKNDRGMMTNLRCMLVDSKRHRAWPALNRLGVRIGDDDSSYVAGLFAAHPEETATGNLGATCKMIEQRRGEKRTDDNKLTPTERRFQHLLAAERDELPERLVRLILMAKAQGVPVNYEQLETDLRFWNDRTKTEWAAAFWDSHAVFPTRVGMNRTKRMRDRTSFCVPHTRGDEPIDDYVAQREA